MPETIVVGYDGSAGSADAAALGGQLAEAAGRALTLVAVRPPRIPRSVESGEEHDERLWELARGALRDAPVAPEVERHAVCGESVAHGLQSFAERANAAAIVVGCPERTSAGHVEAGTVARRLLHGSPCAVALAPRAHAQRHPGPFRRIVVGYTDSDEARGALRVAAGLARACDATVRVVSVVSQSPSWATGLAGYTEAIRGEAEADLDRVLRRLAGAVATEGVLLDGDPVQRLLEQAHDWADLIVTGSRGYGPRRQVLLGSVSAGLLAAATVPVIVTPRGADTELLPEPAAATSSSGARAGAAVRSSP